MQHLPTSEEQAWLIGALAQVIRTRGSTPFISSPILEPTSDFFPESRGSASFCLDRTTRRLLQYAGLKHLDVSFETFSEPDLQDDSGEQSHCNSIAAYFRGIDRGICRFGLNEDQSTDLEYLVGVMAHEVAHAYRRSVSLECDAPEEELLTDITTVYLGFGVLTANNSLRHRTAGEVSGNQAYTYWSISKAGYLPPQALIFLLAIQITFQGLDSPRRRRISSHLETNQAAFLRAALRHVDSDRDRLSAMLTLPQGYANIQQKNSQEILEPIPEFIAWENDPAEEPVQEEQVNTARPVFRVQRTRAVQLGIAGIVIFGGIGMWMANAFAQPLLGPAFGILGLCVGAAFGRTYSHDICSDPECNAILPSDSLTCPDCGGNIRGRIRAQDDRLEAEERLESKVSSPDGTPE